LLLIDNVIKMVKHSRDTQPITSFLQHSLFNIVSDGKCSSCI